MSENVSRIRLTDWLAIMRTIRQILRQAADILELPDPDNPQAVYGWLHTIAVIADQISKATPTAIDDRIVSWLLDGPLASYENFLPFYQVFRAILELINSEFDDANIAAKIATLPEATILENSASGLPTPELILMLVKLIRLILDLAR